MEPLRRVSRGKGNMDSVLFGEVAAMGTALLWTLSALAWTSAGRKIGALPVSFLRLAITCLFLATYGWFARGLWLPTDASSNTWLFLGLSGFLGFFLSDLCLFKAFLLIGPRLALLVQSFTPPLTAVLSFVYLEKDLSVRHWLAMGVTLAGVAWVVLERSESSHVPQTHRQFRWGIALAGLAAVAQAGGLVLTARGLGDYDAVAATFIRVLGGMTGYLALITVVGRWAVMLNAAGNRQAMAIMAGGAIVGPCLGVALCMEALRYCHPGVAATIINTTPVLILPFAIFLYREKVSPRAACGAALSVLGIALLAF